MYSLVMLPHSKVCLKLILHVDRIHYFLVFLIIWIIQVWLSKVKTMFWSLLSLLLVSAGLLSAFVRVFDNK